MLKVIYSIPSRWNQFRGRDQFQFDQFSVFSTFIQIKTFIPSHLQTNWSSLSGYGYMVDIWRSLKKTRMYCYLGFFENQAESLCSSNKSWKANIVKGIAEIIRSFQVSARWQRWSKALAFLHPYMYLHTIAPNGMDQYSWFQYCEGSFCRNDFSFITIHHL